MRRTLLILPALLLASALTGCGGSSVDATCDVAGVTDEVEHILMDADGELGEVTSLTCTDGSAYATATVVNDRGETEDPFLLRGSDMGWILTSEIEACSEGSPLAIAEELRDIACPK